MSITGGDPLGTSLFCAENHPFTSALILASGNGTRMGADVAKQFLEIKGRSVLERAVDPFEACGYIDEIIITCREKDLSRVAELVNINKWKKIKTIIFGDKTRQESAYKAFCAISDISEFVAVHDAARCLIRCEDIDAVAEEAFKYGAAIAVSKVKDTVKIIGDDFSVVHTPERDTLAAAGTPQIFGRYEYKKAAEFVRSSGLSVTDDSMMLEMCGIRVRVVDVGDENIKITSPSDLYTAERIIEERSMKS